MEYDLKKAKKSETNPFSFWATFRS
jgi:hypothetical protein